MDSVYSFLEMCKKLCPIVTQIKNVGGTAYLVGGGVRDLVLDYPVKDADVEVHGITTEELQAVLSKFGRVAIIGKQFGVLRLYNLDADWSLPRTDSCGRKPTVKIDPNMDIKTACRRRDLTMNAMAIDLNLACQNLEKIKKLAGNKKFDPVKDLEIIDPYGGLDDIKNKQLRAVDKKLFLEDPLRFFRVMQFVGRFEMQPDAELNKLCKTMPLFDVKPSASPLGDGSTSSPRARLLNDARPEPVEGYELQVPLAKERIHEEIKKLFLKSKHSSLGFRWLLKIGRLKEIFPELNRLVGIKQKVQYHPEGDVFEHTMQAVDAAANIEFYDAQNIAEEKYLISLCALCHDIGKATKTSETLSCKGHDLESAKMTTPLLKRLTNNKALIKAVKKLVRFHCMPLQLMGQKSSLKAYKKLALKLAPETNLRQLGLLWLADNRGRSKDSTKLLKGFGSNFLKFIEMSGKANVTHQPEPAALLGRHLMDSVKPGPEMGTLLKKAYKIQIEQGISDWKELKRRVLKG